MVGPFGSAPVVDPYAGRPDKKKWYETFGETLAPALLQMANLVGSKAMDYGLGHAQETYKGQVDAAGKVDDAVTTLLGSARGTPATAGEKGKTVAKPSFDALRYEGQQKTLMPPDLTTPVAPEKPTPTVTTPAAATATPEAPLTASSFPVIGKGAPSKVSMSVSGANREALGFPQSQDTKDMVGYGKRLAAAQVPFAEESALAGREATQGARQQMFVRDQTAKDAAAAKEYNPAKAFSGYEAEWWALRQKQGLKVDADNLMQRADAKRYAIARMEADPEFTKQRTLTEAARISMETAKDFGELADHFGGATQKAGGNTATMANQAQQDAAAALRMWWQDEQKRDKASPRPDPIQHQKNIEFLSDRRNKAVAEGNQAAVAHIDSLIAQENKNYAAKGGKTDAYSPEALPSFKGERVVTQEKQAADREAKMDDLATRIAAAQVAAESRALTIIEAAQLAADQRELAALEKERLPTAANQADNEARIQELRNKPKR